MASAATLLRRLCRRSEWTKTWVSQTQGPKEGGHRYPMVLAENRRFGPCSKLNPADLEVLMVALVAELLGDLW